MVGGSSGLKRQTLSSLLGKAVKDETCRPSSCQAHPRKCAFLIDGALNTRHYLRFGNMTLMLMITHSLSISRPQQTQNEGQGNSLAS